MRDYRRYLLREADPNAPLHQQRAGRPRRLLHPLTPQLRPVLQAWLDERRSWHVADSKALFLNRRGGRLTTRGASDIFTAIATAADLDDKITAHVGRHTFVNQLVPRPR